MNTDTRLIPLTQGKSATVDACDFEWLNQFKWCAIKSRTSYGYRWYSIRREWPSNQTVYMHREIAKRAKLPDSKEYDHRDRNGLNNVRSNLRPCTQGQNNANQTKGLGKTSQYKGVHWDKVNQKWIAKIGVAGGSKWLGRFEDEIEAAMAYDAAARKYYGEFACLNFPNGESSKA